MKALVHISGGLDSAAALLLTIEKLGRENILGVLYNYGQPYYKQEHDAAVGLADTLSVGLAIFDIPMWVNPKEDYVPFRNLVLFSHSIHIAAIRGIDIVVVGSKTDKVRDLDPYSFRDSSYRVFVHGFNTMLRDITEPGRGAPQIVMPLKGWSKQRVVRYLQDQNVNMTKLWNCYRNGPAPCGGCYHCAELQEIWDADQA